MGLETRKFGKEQPIDDIANQIAMALQGIRFGSVEIIIHESKVVQIERKEKLRFDKRSTLEKCSF
ncbi:MAG: YezD family protein [Methyloglobulus sp.]|nr:YezD family protein [Methyloglobulus sp.]